MMRPRTDRLALVGAIDGPTPEEAVALFAIARKTPDEGRLIDALLTQHAHQPLPEPLLVAVAAALVDRAEPRTAERALASATSHAALLLRADLLAGCGALEEAARLVERILARDIDHPGARERHARWTRARSGPSESATPTAPAAPPTPAWVEAPYRCVREVARGGAGTVYEVIDDALGRRLALKVYHKPDRARAQLLHEARVAAALGGEGVVRVFDVDPTHGWLAMEWAALGTLGSYLKCARVNDGRGAAPTDASNPSMTRSLCAIARALAGVHASGWVHNDIKPANVLLVTEHRVVLGDLGAARRRGEPSPPGSRGYVSRERSTGRASDPRDDVHAFGRVIEAVCAEPAARAEPAVQSRRTPPAPEEGDAALGTAAERDFWLRLAAACTGEDRLRPADGRELVRRIETLRPCQERTGVSRLTDKGG